MINVDANYIKHNQLDLNSLSHDDILNIGKFHVLEVGGSFYTLEINNVLPDGKIEYCTVENNRVYEWTAVNVIEFIREQLQFDKVAVCRHWTVGA